MSSVIFLNMSKQVGEPGTDYGWNYRRATPPALPFHNLQSWGFEIADELARQGHDSHFVSIDTRDFLFGMYGRDYAYQKLDSGCTVHYLHRPEDIHWLVSHADTIIIRHDYEAYSDFLERLEPDRHTVIQVLAGQRVNGLLWQPQCQRYSLLVNGPMEVEQFGKHSDSCEVFLKPATKKFQRKPDTQVSKRHDIAFICWDAAVARKRFGLFLDGVELLCAKRSAPLRVLVVGDSSRYDHRLSNMARNGTALQIVRTGEVHHDDVPDLLRSAHLTVVTSDDDANPQVISESIAVGTPVACAADISGGAFQITPDTGALFAGDAQSLARVVDQMLDNLSRFKPREHRIRIEHTVEQIERLVSGYGRTP